MDEVKETFRPEFLNRVDEIIVFHPLEQEHIRQIAALMLRQLGDRLAERGMKLEFDDSAVNLLAEAGYDLQYGARPLRRAIQRKVEDALSEEILSGRIRMGQPVFISAKDGELTFTAREPAAQTC